MVKTQQRQEQRQRVLKAKVAMAMYSEYGRVPKEREIYEVYHLPASSTRRYWAPIFYGSYKRPAVTATVRISTTVDDTAKRLDTDALSRTGVFMCRFYW